MRRPLVRSLAIGLALLCAGMPVLGGAHAGSEAHRYCIQHQTLEDVDDGTIAPDADPSPGIARAPETRAHEACPFAASTGAADRARLAPPAVALLAAPAAEPPVPPTPLPVSLVLTVAPKTSPPPLEA